MSTVPSKKSRNWVWFFAILAVLAISGVSYEVWYNLHQQLKPAELNTARRLWEANGPFDYRLEYKVDTSPEPATSTPDQYTVVVRGGKVVSVKSVEDRRLPAKELVFGTMAELFDFIMKQQADDAEPGRPRPFVKATFDPDDGHVVHYVRSVMRTGERLEISVRLEAMPP
jgi:hypothetical protein